MNRIISRLRHEFAQVIFPAVFFFITFILIAYTRDLMMMQYGIRVSTVVTAAFGALIVAKVVVVVDMMPFMNLFPDRPLIYNVIWKTSIYMIATLVVRYVENLAPFFFDSWDFALANHQLGEAIIWTRFWATQIWLLVLFLIYGALRELIRVLGRERVTHLFFGPLDARSA